jgi:hypothetical protein
LTSTIDIHKKIKSDFEDKSNDVILILDEAISKADHLNNDRIIRCILFLADKDLEKLKKSIEAATRDPRDVMYWAEYTNHDTIDKTTRIRDFSQPF